MPLIQSTPTLHTSYPIPTTYITRSHASHVPTIACHAQQMFDQIPERDTFAWNTLIRTHLAEGEPHKAASTYSQMMVRGVHPNKHTLPRVITAMSIAGDLLGGRQVHGHVYKHGFAADEYVVTTLVSMYGRIQGADTARAVLEGNCKGNSVAWTQLMKLYLEEGKPELALRVFERMGSSDVAVDAVALATALKACGMLKSVRKGNKVREAARRCGLDSDLLVGNSMLKMYANCGRIDYCRGFFEEMGSKDVVSWTTIIGEYVRNGEFNEGLKLFQAMCTGGMKPDAFAVTSVLPACARVTACKNGKEIHGYLIRHKVDMTTVVMNALMDMYVKSGCLESASAIFYRLEEKDIVSWTVMILGYSLHGQGQQGVELFRAIEKRAPFSLNQTIYAAGLYACYVARFVEEGKCYFNRISKREIEHLTIMVGLYARAGLFPEARAFVREYGIEMIVGVQRALLDGCRIHKNIRLGKRIAEQLLELEPLNPENYILMSNLHAWSARWDRAEELRENITDMGLRATKAYSWIEVRRKFHVFGVGDVSHPRSKRIYLELKDLKKKMEARGYVPEDDFSLHEVDEERECVQSGHSEMLAVAFGLISNPGRSAVRVTKNLRVCRSCHSSAKMISKIVGREILLKDPNFFHHFKNGLCSCEDFW